MKLNHILIILGLLITQTTKAQLSESATISIITCGPGSEFYTTFGHSAIRICDTAQSYDAVYNYGTFDFNTPNFYWKFAQGKLDYCLSKTHYTNFLASYIYEGRYVIEQYLNLTEAEKNRIYTALEYNYKPENRHYLYDFFIDNCATRVRDIVNNNIIDRELFVTYTPENAKSYRELLYDCTEERLLWWRLGIDLLLGARCDKKCNNIEQMFSPIEMKNQFDTTQLSDGSGTLVTKQIDTLYETRTLPRKSVSPTLVFWVMCISVITLTITSWKKNWSLKWLDRLLFGTVGAISIVLLFMWFGTDHFCTKNNWNLLWSSPLFIYLAFTTHKSNRWIILIQTIMILIVLAGQWIIPQQFNSAITPISVALTIRLIDNLRK